MQGIDLDRIFEVQEFCQLLLGFDTAIQCRLCTRPFVICVVQFAQQEEPLFPLRLKGICCSTGLLCGVDCFVETGDGLTFIKLGSETLRQVSPRNFRIRVCGVTPLSASCCGKRHPGGLGRQPVPHVLRLRG